MNRLKVSNVKAREEEPELIGSSPSMPWTSGVADWPAAVAIASINHHHTVRHASPHLVSAAVLLRIRILQP